MALLNSQSVFKRGVPDSNDVVKIPIDVDVASLRQVVLNGHPTEPTFQLLLEMSHASGESFKLLSLDTDGEITVLSEKTGLAASEPMRRPLGSSLHALSGAQAILVNGKSTRSIFCRVDAAGRKTDVEFRGLSNNRIHDTEVPVPNGLSLAHACIIVRDKRNPESIRLVGFEWETLPGGKKGLKAACNWKFSLVTHSFELQRETDLELLEGIETATASCGSGANRLSTWFAYEPGNADFTQWIQVGDGEPQDFIVSTEGREVLSMQNPIWSQSCDQVLAEYKAHPPSGNEEVECRQAGNAGDWETPNCSFLFAESVRLVSSCLEWVIDPESQRLVEVASELSGNGELLSFERQWDLIPTDDYPCTALGEPQTAGLHHSLDIAPLLPVNSLLHAADTAWNHRLIARTELVEDASAPGGIRLIVLIRSGKLPEPFPV